MTNFSSLRQGTRHVSAALAGGSLLVALCACQAPFNLDQPTTRALEAGASGTLSAAQSLEISGTYAESPNKWTVDMQLAGFNGDHIVATSSNVTLEAIVIRTSAFFRGQQFLSDHMGKDPQSRSIVQAAGNSWWRGSVGLVPRLPDLTDGLAFKSTFLGAAVTQRLDHVAVDGQSAVDLSGPRADVYISTVAPYRVLRVRLKKGAVIDGLSDGDLRYSNFGKDFHLASPTNVIDFSNLSTLPPIYSVEAVDTTRCTQPCIVSASLRNLGGLSGAKAPSTIAFTMVDPASGQVLGSCQATVTPDVGYNGTAVVSCTVAGPRAQVVNAATVTAVADNPGRG